MSSTRREKRKKQAQEAAFQAAVNGGTPNPDVQRKAVMDVVQLWLDRLQLISVIVSTAVGREYRLSSLRTRSVDVVLRVH